MKSDCVMVWVARGRALGDSDRTEHAMIAYELDARASIGRGVRPVAVLLWVLV